MGVGWAFDERGALIVLGPLERFFFVNKIHDHEGLSSLPEKKSSISKVTGGKHKALIGSPGKPCPPPWPLVCINLNREPTGQSVPYYKLMETRGHFVLILFGCGLDL